MAKELGYTLQDLREHITAEEVLIWHSFFLLQRQEEEKTINKNRMRR